MIFEDLQSLRKRIREVTKREAPDKVKVFEDTSRFMSIERGSVLRLGSNDYLVSGHAREGRFGIDEQPKFWVKPSIDLTTGERKIIKLVFNEMFQSRIGAATYRCIRSPEKEAAILQKMEEHPNFMHGHSVRDAAGNLVRVLNFISGPSLYKYLQGIAISHKSYYQQMMPDIMRSVIDCFDAIASLHKLGLSHGDIRADHLILKNNTATYVWIDFDYEVSHPKYDVFCLGNVLQQVVGKGRHSLHDILLQPSDYPDFNVNLVSSDMSMMYPHRIANLHKLFPYLSADLHDILMRFAAGAAAPYDTVEQLLKDLRLLFSSERC